MDMVIPTKKSYCGQFCVSLTGIRSTLENSLEIEGLTLEYDRHVPIHRLFDLKNEMIGVVVGVLIDTESSKIISDDVHLDVVADEQGFAQKVEDRIYCYSGSWVLIVATKLHTRIYLDPCGSLSLVYLSTSSVAGSTTGLLLDDQAYLDTLDQSFYDQLCVQKNGWFPAGLTAHRNVKRLLANHYLDLRTLRSKRHWPHKDFVPDLPLKQGAARIAELVTSAIIAMKQDGPTVLAITGGKDSRMLLAGCRSFIKDIDLITIDMPGSERDLFLAKKVAALDSAIHHRVLPPVLASEEERQSWLYNASHCVGGTNQYYSLSLRPLCGYKYFVSGICAEIGRAFLWRDTDYAELEIDAPKLIARLGLKYDPQLEKPIKAWLDDVSSLNFFTMIDLAYTELRVSAWAYAHAYAYACKGYTSEISPFNNRELIGIFLSLKPEDRRSGAYINEGINIMWPDLLTIPFNRYGNFRDFWEVLKVLSDPVKVTTKLRKVFLGK